MPNIVRLTTESFVTDRGVFRIKKLIQMKRLSKDCHSLIDIANDIGAEETYDDIRNIDNCNDGLYEVVFVADGPIDYETGDQDFYLELIPVRN